MKTIEQLLKDYLDYLEIEVGRSLKTQENYERYLKLFFKSADIKNLKDITTDKIKEFRLYLARKLTGGKNLIKNDYEVLSPDKIELPKITQRQIEIIDETDLVRLLKAPAGKTIKELRDKAMLEVLFSTGLRVSELVNLDRYLNLDK